jgi:hypothetical protein
MKRGYLIFKLNYVILYEAIKLVTLIVVVASLIGVLVRVYTLYTLGDKAYKLLNFYNSYQGNLNFYQYTLDIPVWKEGIYIFLFNTTLQDLATTIPDKCLILQSGRWDSCYSNPNYCANSLCLCFVEFSDVKSYYTTLLATTLPEYILGKYMVFSLGTCCDLEYALILKLSKVENLVVDKDLYLGISPYHIERYQTICDVSNYYDQAFGHVSLLDPQFLNLAISFGKVLQDFSSKAKAYLLSTTFPNSNGRLYCMKLEEGLTIPVLNEYYCNSNEVVSFPLLVGIFAFDDVYYLSGRTTYLSLTFKKIQLFSGRVKVLAISRYGITSKK